MKRIIRIIVLSLLLILPLSLKAEVNLKERTESNNYGVNKKWYAPVRMRISLWLDLPPKYRMTESRKILSGC